MRIRLNMRYKTRRCLLLMFSQIIFIYVVWYVLVKRRNSSPQKINLQVIREDGVEETGNHIIQTLTGITSPIDVVENETIGKYTTSVFLLNIPSTQGSSVQNILLRKALNSKLNVALPQPNKDSMCFPRLFETVCPMNKNDVPFDMILHQLRYERKVLSSVLKPNTKYVVLLRHPILHLQASYYDNDWSDYNRGKPFESFVNNKYYRLAKHHDYDSGLPYRDIQLFMLGLQPGQNDLRELVDYKIDTIEKEFDVIMFQEHMLESLVLLKHELNWDYEELVTFGLHAHPENYKLDELTQEVNDTIIFYNEGDMKLYEILIERFHKKIKDIGEDNMKREKELMQRAITKEVEHCLDKTEEELQAAKRRIERRLSWDGESDRYCHFHISRGSELTSLLSFNWKGEQEKYKKQLLKGHNKN